MGFGSEPFKPFYFVPNFCILRREERIKSRQRPRGTLLFADILPCGRRVFAGGGRKGRGEGDAEENEGGERGWKGRR